MAFYISRVDGNGNEIERRYFRKPKTSASTSSDNASNSFEFGDISSRGTSSGNLERSSFGQRSEEIVPPLDISNSEHESAKIIFEQPITSHTYTLPRKCVTGTIKLKPNPAYEDWLFKKRQRDVNESLKRKLELEIEKHQAAERRQLAAENFQKWLKEKKTRGSDNPVFRGQKGLPSIKTTTPKQRFPLSARNVAEKQKKLEEWVREKRKQEMERRLREQVAEQQKEREKAARLQQSRDAHERWLARNKNAPKPVPFGQGLLTLRGTVSKIYINPNEWRID